MKAKVNGVEVEGTPQEIAEYMRLITPIKTPDWWIPQVHPPTQPYKPVITCGDPYVSAAPYTKSEA